MSVAKRAVLNFFHYLPVLILVWIIGLLVLSNSLEKRTIQSHSVDAGVGDGEKVRSLEFQDAVPSLEALGQFSELRRLSFRNIALDDSTVRSIQSTTNLRSLALFDCDIEDHQLQDLSSSLPQLTELNLSGSKLSSTCSIPFSNLKILKLNGCGWVNDQTMSSIYNLSGLTSLDLSDTSVNEAGLLDFGRLPALRELNLWGIDGLSDRILIALRINTSLRSLALSSPVFSLRAAKDFQDSIPDARLHIPLHDFAELKPFLRPLTVTAQSSTDLGPLYNGGLQSITILNNSGKVDFSFLPIVPKLEYLSLDGWELTDQQLRHVAAISGLKSLDLFKSSISDVGMETVGRIESLTSLSLHDTKLTDAALKHVTHLTHLAELDLTNTAVSESGLKLLTKCRELEVVRLSGNLWSDEVIQALSELPKLFRAGNSRFRTLDLADSTVSAAGLRLLADLPIELLRLNNLPLNDADLECLQNWPTLQSLDLSGTNVSGESLDLTSHTLLTHLWLDETNLSDASVVSLRLPDSIVLLTLSKTKITGESLPKLKLPHLHSLELADTPLSEQGLRNVLKLPIQSLVLTDVQLRNLPAQHGSKITSFSVHGNSPIFDSLPNHSIAASLSWLKLTEASAQDFDNVGQLTSLSTLTLVDCSLADNSFKRICNHPTLTSITLKNCQLSPKAINELGQIKHLTSVSSSNQFEELQQLKESRSDLQIYDTTSWN